MNIFFTLIFSLISAAALIIIYSMRVRRKPEKVSALFLWQGLRHTSVDHPFLNKFFKEKLFYIHTAILLFLLAALLQSGLGGSSGTVQRSIFIIDATASMKALENGESRIGLAKKKALSLLENFKEAEVMIISAGKPVSHILPYSRNREDIIKAIKEIEAGDTTTDIKDALLTIKPYLRESDHIYLFSDGAFEGLSSLIDETPDISFIPFGTSGENAGIQALEIYQGDNDEYMSVGVTVKNFGKADAISTVDLLSEGKIIDAQRIELPAGREKTMSFSRVPAVTGNITARLNHKDALSSDNYRYAVLSAPAYTSVLLVTEENFFLDKLLGSLTNYNVIALSPEEHEKDIQAIEKKYYDIGIYDNYVPTVEMSRASAYINPAKDIYGISWGDGFYMPENIYSLKEHPVMNYTDFSDIKIQKAKKVRSFEGLALLGSSGSPLIIISNRQGKDRAILSFDIKDSNFPKSVNFPVFFTNLMNRLQPDKDNREKYNINGGEAFSTRLTEKSGNRSKTIVKYPDGSERNIEIENGGIIFSDTSNAGIYSVLHEGGEIKFAVNIPPAESDINPAEYTPPHGRTQEINKTAFISYSAMWKIFGILAILLLFMEKRIRERLS
ncbi:MAG: VWA domain-containing protein [Nitrospirae bacterium]|nr:VWA domain-containing protein [Nitrospirota bacterium]